MGLSGIKGAILEELILYLLEVVGYRIILPGEEGTRNGKSGLDVEGRGEWHQIDAFAAFDYTPAFMYPLRLLVEAKCYDDSRPIGIAVVRNAVGTLKDISENYFTYAPNTSQSDSLKVQRFNYQSAIFSTSGYTKGAQNFAIAHQIFLIQYDGVLPFRPLSQGLKLLNEDSFKKGFLKQKASQHQVRCFVRSFIKNEEMRDVALFNEDELHDSPFNKEGTELFNEHIVKPLLAIKGSYIGMLNGKWPIHLLSKVPLHDSLFSKSSIKCRKLYRDDTNSWIIVPLDMNGFEATDFKLEFSLPPLAADFVTCVKKNEDGADCVERNELSFITLSGKAGNLRRQINLELEGGWNTYYRSISKEWEYE